MPPGTDLKLASRRAKNKLFYSYSIQIPHTLTRAYTLTYYSFFCSFFVWGRYPHTLHPHCSLSKPYLLWRAHCIFRTMLDTCFLPSNFQKKTWQTIIIPTCREKEAKLQKNWVAQSCNFGSKTVLYSQTTYWDRNQQNGDVFHRASINEEEKYWLYEWISRFSYGKIRIGLAFTGQWQHPPWTASPAPLLQAHWKQGFISYPLGLPSPLLHFPLNIKLAQSSRKRVLRRMTALMNEWELFVCGYPVRTVEGIVVCGYPHLWECALVHVALPVTQVCVKAQGQCFSSCLPDIFRLQSSVEGIQGRNSIRKLKQKQWRKKHDLLALFQAHALLAF